MIVRNRPSAIRLFLLWRGSVLPRILPALLVNTLIAVVVTLNHGDLFAHKITLTTIPFTLIGLPIAIFLGFRNTAAYDRYWEGRKLWGEILLRARNLARQCNSLIVYPQPVRASNGLDDIRVRMVYRTIAYAHALRHYLRGSAAADDTQRFLQAPEWQAMASSSNPPDLLMQRMGRDLQQGLQEGRIDPCLAASIDATVSAMAGAGAACERIKSTPIPFSYTLLLHRTAYLYCFLLPFGLVDTIGFMTPLVVAIVTYTFFALDALGDEIEEPFGLEPNDLPLDAICRGLEINLRETLEDVDIPPPLQPVDFRLS
jgi:putative membrane protein